MISETFTQEVIEAFRLSIPCEDYGTRKRLAALIEKSVQAARVQCWASEPLITVESSSQIQINAASAIASDFLQPVGDLLK